MRAIILEYQCVYCRSKLVEDKVSVCCYENIRYSCRCKGAMHHAIVPKAHGNYDLSGMYLVSYPEKLEVQE